MFGFFHRNATSGITIGTVTTGNTASAEITPDGKLNLVLPAMSEQAEQRLTAAEAAIAAAQSLASTADTKADAAASAAAQAQSDVAAAKQEVTTDMNNQLNPIRTKLNTVSDSVQAAQRTADSAQATASAAQGSIDTVARNVETAQSTANTAVNQAIAASTAAANALARGLEVVWHNPDDDGTRTTLPEFGQQDYSVDLSEYIAFMVVYAPMGSVEGARTDMCLIDQNVVLTNMGHGSQSEYFYRTVSFSSYHNKILFGRCEKNASTVSNVLCIPLYVFGIKSIGGLPATA